MSDSTDLILPKGMPAIRTEQASIIVQKREQIALQLCPGIPPDNFFAACLIEANKLAPDVDVASVALTAIRCAIVGLMPGDALGHAHFIPFKDKNRGGRKFCQLVIGYKGFLDLAYSNSFLAGCHADVVLAGETFRHWVDARGPQIEHDLGLDRELSWKNVSAAYVQYTTRSGYHGIEVVGRKELENVNSKKNVWASDPISMSKKTPIRRAAKMWKLTPRMAMAVHWDEQAERDEAQTGGITNFENGATQRPFSLIEGPAEQTPEPQAEPDPSLGRDDPGYAEYERQAIQAEEPAEQLF